MDNLVQTIAFGQDPTDQFKRLRFRLGVNESARVAILTDEVFKALVHFDRTYFYCLGEDCPACEEKGPSPRYLVWIYVYNTDDRGIPLQPLSGRIRAWMFGRDKYAALSAIAQQNPDLRAIDLMVLCTEEKFQRMTITPAQKCYWLEDKDKAKEILAELKELSVDPMDLMARRLTRAQITNVGERPATTAPASQAPRYRSPSDEEDVIPTVDSVASRNQLRSLLDDLGDI